jgi:hypothetical protein
VQITLHIEHDSAIVLTTIHSLRPQWIINRCSNITTKGSWSCWKIKLPIEYIYITQTEHQHRELELQNIL